MLKQIIFFSFFICTQTNSMQNQQPIKVFHVYPNLDFNWLKNEFKLIANKLNNIKLSNQIEQSSMSSSLLHLLTSITNTQDYIKNMHERDPKYRFYTSKVLLQCNIQIIESISLNIISQDIGKIAENLLIDLENTKKILISVYNDIVGLESKLDNNEI